MVRSCLLVTCHKSLRVVVVLSSICLVLHILLLDFPCPFAHGVFISHYMPSSPGQVIIIRAAVTQNVENASQNDSQTRCIVVTGQNVAAG